jgi:hypothetical protein
MTWAVADCIFIGRKLLTAAWARNIPIGCGNCKGFGMTSSKSGASSKSSADSLIEKLLRRASLAESEDRKKKCDFQAGLAAGLRNAAWEVRQHQAEQPQDLVTANKPAEHWRRVAYEVTGVTEEEVHQYRAAIEAMGAAVPSGILSREEDRQKPCPAPTSDPDYHSVTVHSGRERDPRWGVGTLRI